MLRAALSLRRIVTVTPGQLVSGFRVDRVSPRADFDVTVVDLTHVATGARYVHVDAQDSNNTFGVGFKTVPKDSTGVAHILEHTALCGSRLYPVRDPFFNMLRRSLQTFMNAYTSADWTLYPFSTQNRADYENLLRVYLDAAFFPNLTEHDFRQEGHRFEFETAADPASPLAIKGVVYNEMKGAMSDPASLFGQRLQQELFPAVTYGNNSGGDPSCIPSLTHAQLVGFHRTHYHPSNSYLFSYGNFRLEDTLALVEERALGLFKEAIDPKTAVPRQPRFKEPRTVRASCPPDAVEAVNGNKVAVAFVTGQPNTDPFHTLACQVLGGLLTDSPSGPMYAALLGSRLGDNFTPGTGFDSSTAETTFAFGVQGVRDEDMGRVEGVVMDTLRRVAQDGFPRERVDAMLHQVELSVRRGSTNFGLAVLTSHMSSWVHGGALAEDLDVSALIARLRGELDRGPFLQNLVRGLLVENPHRVTLEMRPDPAFMEAQAAEERRFLAKAESSLTAADRARLVHEAADLKARQEATPDVSCLPTVRVADIERTRPATAVDSTLRRVAAAAAAPAAASGLARMHWCHQPTNGLVYVRVALDSERLPEAARRDLPLFLSLITELGAGKLDPAGLADATRKWTGGLHASVSVMQDPAEAGAFKEVVEISGSAFAANVPRLLELLEMVILEPNLAGFPSELAANVAQYANGITQGLISRGNRYASSHAAAALSPASARSEVYSGLAAVSHATRAYAQGSAEVEAVREAFLSRASLLGVAVNLQEKARAAVEPAVEAFLARLAGRFGANAPQGPPERQAMHRLTPLPPGAPLALRVLPSPVNYVAAVAPTGVSARHPDAPHLQLLARVISNNYLHREIREKGGAYGSSCSHGDGLWAFSTYRDPNTTGSLDVFRDSLQWAARGGFTEDHLNEAKLQVFAARDYPTHPGSKGLGRFYSPFVTHTDTQRSRAALLDATRADLLRAAEVHLGPKWFAASASISILGPKRDGAVQWEGRKGEAKEI